MKAGSGAGWLVGITLLALVGGLIIYSYADWPGARYFGIADKKFWDYLELLIVPAALAFGVYWLNRTQDIRQQEADALQQRLQREANQMQQDRALETVNQQQQDAALREYLDQMAVMLLPNKDQPSLYRARPGDSLSSVARARTLTVLPRLDGRRKARVVQFLHESGLIATERLIFHLRGADASKAELFGADLIGADLREINLRGANMFGADLSGADLSGAYLSETDLSDAFMSGADLRGAYVSGAKLLGADLRDASLLGADLRGADLSAAYLSGVELIDAFMSEVELNDADLSGADLSGADLRDANLSGSTGITDEELEQQANSLEGATMTNGQKYEDWIKDKGGSRKNVENG